MGNKEGSVGTVKAEGVEAKMKRDKQNNKNTCQPVCASTKQFTPARHQTLYYQKKNKHVFWFNPFIHCWVFKRKSSLLQCDLIFVTLLQSTFVWLDQANWINKLD